jgi:predicted dehydrogenase
MVGAGNICEFHVAAVKALPEVELVGVYDLDRERARAAAERWGTRAFDTFEELIAAGANVIHGLTPPSSHVAVARTALDHGCHVLIEKPIAEDESEARQLGELAKAKGLTVGVNHSLLFDPQIRRALDEVASGAIGDVVSVDILRGSEYPPYAGGPLPPWYRDAGYPFRDLGVHCLYLIQELLGPIEDIDAAWRSLGGDRDLAFDEWRALVRCSRGLGQFQLTFNAKPMQSQVLIHGTKGLLRVDLFAMFNSHRRATPLPKAAERLVNAFTDSIEPLIDVPIGVVKFIRKEVQAYQGLRDLVADFYRCLAAGEPPPVTVDDAASVVHWVEKIARAADEDHEQRLAKFPRSEPTSSRAHPASSATRSSSDSSIGASGCACSCGASPTSRSTASSTRSATSPIQPPSAARSQAPTSSSTQVPRWAAAGPHSKAPPSSVRTT